MSAIRFATRPSALARWQTGWVIAALKAAWPQMTFEEVVMTTRGDRQLDRPLPEIGGKGLFTQELEAALLDGSVDAAVHSLKDLPTEVAPGLTVGAIPERAEVRDVWVCPAGYTPADLPPGSLVGTSSLRRSAQLRAQRPDLSVASIRGNVDTRLRKVQAGDYDAILLAGAGLVRLGRDEAVTAWLSLDEMLPAPGQGALAVQCRADDERVLMALAAIEHAETRRATQAERAFLAELGGGCALPVGAYASPRGEELYLLALVASLDGDKLIRLAGSGRDAQELGGGLARRALDMGAGTILAQIKAKEVDS